MQHYSYDINALISALRRSERLQSFMMDILRFRLMTSQNRDIEDRLFGPNITRESRAALLATVVTPFFSPEFSSFLVRLLGNGDLGSYPALADQLLENLRREDGIDFVQVVSTVPLSGSQLERIQRHVRTLLGTRAVTYNTIDRSLAGGFAVLVREKIVDLSVRHDLERIRQALLFRENKGESDE